jgi:8-oxo-dGTP diphosphatase
MTTIMKPTRYTKTSVNNFIHCGDEYLFVKRAEDKEVDAGRLNSIGGKLEPGENWLDCVIRETEEEVGLKLETTDVEFLGIVRLEGGYEEDWIMCFFRTEVARKNIPEGHVSSEGEFMWLHKDKVLESGYELVDDLYYSWNDIINSEQIFFASAQLNEKQKVQKYSVTKLHRKK